MMLGVFFFLNLPLGGRDRVGCLDTLPIIIPKAIEPTHVHGVRQSSLTLFFMGETKNSAWSSLDISKYFKTAAEEAKDLVTGI